MVAAPLPAHTPGTTSKGPPPTAHVQRTIPPYKIFDIRTHRAITSEKEQNNDDENSRQSLPSAGVDFRAAHNHTHQSCSLHYGAQAVIHQGNLFLLYAAHSQMQSKEPSAHSQMMLLQPKPVQSYPNPSRMIPFFETKKFSLPTVVR